MPHSWILNTRLRLFPISPLSFFLPLSIHNPYRDLNVLLYQWHNFICGHTGSCLTTSAVKTAMITSHPTRKPKCLFHIHGLIFRWCRVVRANIFYQYEMLLWSADISSCAFNEIIDNSIDSERLVWPWHLLGRLFEKWEPDIVLIYIAVTHQVGLFLIGLMDIRLMTWTWSRQRLTNQVTSMQYDLCFQLHFQLLEKIWC